MIRPPQIVNTLVETVSEKLGREAIFRKINNREGYFILDLAFSYFQKADRNKRNDYRSGYLYIANGDKQRLLFALAHTPVMSSFFKKNFDYERFRAIVEDTAKYRDENILRFSRKGVREEIRTPDLGIFLANLDSIETSGFSKSVFSKSKIGKTGIGNIFEGKEGKRGQIYFLRTEENVLGKTWKLLSWILSIEQLFFQPEQRQIMFNDVVGQLPHQQGEFFLVAFLLLQDLDCSELWYISPLRSVLE